MSPLGQALATFRSVDHFVNIHVYGCYSCLLDPKKPLGCYKNPVFSEVYQRPSLLAEAEDFNPLASAATVFGPKVNVCYLVIS